MIIPQSYTDSGEEWSDLTISYFSYLCGGVGEEQRCLQGALGCGVQKAQARALHGGGGEEQRRFQGALGGGGEKCKLEHSMEVVRRSRGTPRCSSRWWRGSASSSFI